VYPKRTLFRMVYSMNISMLKRETLEGPLPLHEQVHETVKLFMLWEGFSYISHNCIKVGVPPKFISTFRRNFWSKLSKAIEISISILSVGIYIPILTVKLTFR
jgi:hypothetical protein